MNNATKTLNYKPQHDKLSFEWTETDHGPVVSCGAVHTIVLGTWPVIETFDGPYGSPVPYSFSMDFVPLQLLVHQDMSLSKVLDGLDQLRALVMERLEQLKQDAQCFTGANQGKWPTCLEGRAHLAKTGQVPTPYHRTYSNSGDK